MDSKYLPTVIAIALFGALGSVSTSLVAKDLAAPECADLLAAIHKCSDLDNDIARLQCFDEGAASLIAVDPNSAEPMKDSEEKGVAVVVNEEPPARLAPSEVKDSDEAMVAGCEYLGIVVGKSGWGGFAAGAASSGTMRSARKKAAKMGATHIVFGNFDNASAIKASTRQARAYRCPRSAGWKQ